jgi:flagellar hook-length control protein FliK
MVKENIQQANIRLNPAHLGPIEIKMSTQNEQTSIIFSAHHSLTRDALESSMPRLKEFFSESGLHLADAQVSKEPFQKQANSDENGDGQQSAESDSANQADVEQQLLDVDQLLASDRAVDYFA